MCGRVLVCVCVFGCVFVCVFDCFLCGVCVCDCVVVRGLVVCVVCV